MLNQQGKLRDEYLALLARSGLDLALSEHSPDRPPDPYAGGSFDPRANQAAIRWLEQSRGYTTWQGVGTEPEAIYLERLATVRKRQGPYLGDRLPHLQRVLDAEAVAILGAADRHQIRLPFDVFAGLYPTGEFNARVEPVAGGALILINAGLMDLLFCVLKAHLAGAGNAQDPPLLQGRQTSMVLAEAFNAYVYGQGSIIAWPLPGLDSYRNGLLDLVQRAGEYFVLAHELGHIARGHVRLPVAPGGKAEVQLTPETELEADAFAVDLVAFGSGFPDGAPQVQFIAGGMLNVLAIAFALAALADEFQLEQVASGTHPAIADRWTHLASLLNQHFPSADAVRRGEMFRDWLLDKQLGGIVGWLRRVDDVMKRPGRWD